MNTPLVPDLADMAILDALQGDIPIVSRPWEVIAGRLGIPESDLLSRMKKLEDARIIRGISPVLESIPLGLHAATLVALRVPMQQMDEVAAIVSSFPEVSHNFQRDHAMSLWFTIAAPDQDGVQRVLHEILARTGIPAADALDLPTVKRIKIDVRFAFLSGLHREGNFGPD